MHHPFHIHTDRQINLSELEALAIAAGVRPTSFHDHWAVRRGAFSTFVGDLIVRPDARFEDLGPDLLHEHTGIILRAPTVEWDARTGAFIALPPDDFLDDEPA